MELKVTNGEREYLFRHIRPEEADQLILLEHTCFPPGQAMAEKCLLHLTAVAGDLNLVAIDSDTGKIAASLFGLATNEDKFRDEFFTKVSLHNPNGNNVMLLSLEVFPAYRGEGLARILMEQYLHHQREQKRKEVFLTCLAGKIGMYEKMGFMNHGLSASLLGGETWYDMSIVLNKAYNDGQNG